MSKLNMGMPMSFMFSMIGVLKPVFRPAGAADIEAIAQLYRSSRQDLQILGLPESLLNTLLSQQQAAQEMGIAQEFPTAQTWLLAVDEILIARIIFAHLNDCVYLIDIIVAPAFQRRGIARQLIEFLQTMAIENKNSVMLRVMKNNPAARQLYEQCGFVDFAEDLISFQMHWQQEPVASCQ